MAIRIDLSRPRERRLWGLGLGVRGVWLGSDNRSALVVVNRRCWAFAYFASLEALKA